MNQNPAQAAAKEIFSIRRYSRNLIPGIGWQVKYGDKIIVRELTKAAATDLRDELNSIITKHYAPMMAAFKELAEVSKRWKLEAVKTVEECPDELCSHCGKIMPIYNSEKYGVDNFATALANAQKYLKE